jgi:hypothetical protein
MTINAFLSYSNSDKLWNKLASCHVQPTEIPFDGWNARKRLLSRVEVEVTFTCVMLKTAQNIRSRQFHLLCKEYHYCEDRTFATVDTSEMMYFDEEYLISSELLTSYALMNYS